MARRAVVELVELCERFNQLGFRTDDADQALHRLLEIVLDVVRALTTLSSERCEGLLDDPLDLCGVGLGCRAALLRVV